VPENLFDLIMLINNQNYISFSNHTAIPCAKFPYRELNTNMLQQTSSFQACLGARHPYQHPQQKAVGFHRYPENIKNIYTSED
jgi:hypothetical protein